MLQTTAIETTDNPAVPISDYDRYSAMACVIRHPDGVLEIPEPLASLNRITEYLTAQHNAVPDTDYRLKTYYRDGGILLNAIINGDVAPPVSTAAIHRLIRQHAQEFYD